MSFLETDGQSPPQSGRYPNRWPKGVSGNPLGGRVSKAEAARRQARIDERVKALEADYDPSPSQKQLLIVVAGHLDDAQYSRNVEIRCRATNTANRILKNIPRRPAPKPLSVAAYEKLKREGVP